jgi:hypothetical protein
VRLPARAALPLPGRGLAHSTGGTFFQFHTGTVMDRIE